MSFPVRRTRSNIKKCVFFCFGLMLLLGSYWSSLQTFYLLRCGEVKILHWAERSCLLPSWLQFLRIEFCWILFLEWREDTRVLTACQVLLTSQPSWRLESDKPFTRKDDSFFEGHCGPIRVPLITEELLPWCQWRMDQVLIGEREECVLPSLYFLQKLGQWQWSPCLLLGSFSICSWTYVIPRY